MAKSYESIDAMWADVRLLAEAWCDRRCFFALAILLPAYTGFSGLTDSWAELLAALKRLRDVRDELTPGEKELVADLAGAVERALNDRRR